MIEGKKAELGVRHQLHLLKSEPELRIKLDFIAATGIAFRFKNSQPTVRLLQPFR